MPFREINFIKNLFLLIGFLLTLSSCDFLVSDQDNKSDRKVQIELSQIHCLQDVNTNLNLWLKDELAPDKIGTTFDCIDQSIQTFLSATRPAGREIR